MATRHAKVLIIGGGPAGYTAALYTARARLEPLLYLGLQPGGQLTITTDVENYPGFPTTIQGPWLMDQMRLQIEHCGVAPVYRSIVEVDFTRTPFWLKDDHGDEILAETVIIATGAQAKWLDIPSEEKFRGFGVSACATCDGFFFKNQRVAVVGGGNTAVEEALFMTHHASHVTLIHRRDALRAEKMLQEKLFENPKIDVIWNAEVAEIQGQEDLPRKVTHLQLKDTRDGTLLPPLAVDGVFVAIGHLPATQVFKSQITCDAGGYIEVLPGTTKTNIPGVFAAGDVQDKVYRQAVTAAGQGCMAALEAEKYLSGIF